MFTFYDMNRHEVQGNKKFDIANDAEFRTAYALATPTPTPPGEALACRTKSTIRAMKPFCLRSPVPCALVRRRAQQRALVADVVQRGGQHHADQRHCLERWIDLGPDEALPLTARQLTLQHVQQAPLVVAHGP